MRNSQSLHLFLVPIVFSLLSLLCPASASSGSNYDYGAHARFFCTPIPVDADPACHQSVPPAGWWGASEEAKATILHLRESLVQQKETILDQRETIRELTAKLTLCEGLGQSAGVAGHHTNHQGTDKHVTPEDLTSSPEQMERMLQALKERLENLKCSLLSRLHLCVLHLPQQKRNTSITYSSSLKELLQRKINTLEQQLHHTSALSSPNTHRDDRDHRPKSPDAFQISFPMRTNYMYGRVKKTLLQEIFALTLCLWIKAGVGPGLGTPFSYSAPGQANELVLIEWGNNPMELLIDDKSVTLPLSLGDGNRHHVCVTWSTRDGQWEAYQDGVQRGSGINLSPWHPIKPGGVFILGQEQDTLGGRFDATQSFVGEMSDVHMWSHVLTASDIYSLASCDSHLRGDVIAWSKTEVELHGGVTKYPLNPCH
uniref:Si:dkey-283b15.2 n=1 Tax=Sander lucioperca TaxID=283035 RepID=A0A8C9ZCI4_SANLU